MPTTTPAHRQSNTAAQVLFASLIGTGVEFFDFYIYATASVLVFPRLFFPASDPASATLLSFATFGIAFLARPLGSVLFGHFGDRIGRKKTLVLALLTMGLSTVAIGALPTYQTLGVAAPVLLALCRFGQGIGLGGEWGGAVLLAVENAPPHQRAWYGMFPQLGAPLGFLLSSGTFLLLSRSLSNAHFFQYGWRLPFLASAALVVVGLWVRLSLLETPVFEQALRRAEPLRYPVLAVFRHHGRALVAGVLVSMSVFVLFYLMVVFVLSWGTAALGYHRDTLLSIQLIGICLFALFIPVGTLLAGYGRRRVLFAAAALTAVFGLVLAPLFTAGLPGVLALVACGLSLMGVSYGPLGTALSEMFPTAVRYTGSSLAFSFAGILGASMAPFIATSLARAHGLPWVGGYLCASALLTVAGLAITPETRDRDLSAYPCAPPR